MIECSEKSKKTHKYGEMVKILFKLRNKEILTIVTFFAYSTGSPNRHIRVYTKGVMEEV